jgi:hypothetical protein
MPMPSAPVAEMVPAPVFVTVSVARSCRPTVPIPAVLVSVRVTLFVQV